MPTKDQRTLRLTATGDIGVTSECATVSVATISDGLLFLAFAHVAMVVFSIVSESRYENRSRGHTRLSRLWIYAFLDALVTACAGLMPRSQRGVYMSRRMMRTPVHGRTGLGGVEQDWIPVSEHGRANAVCECRVVGGGELCCRTEERTDQQFSMAL